MHTFNKRYLTVQINHIQVQKILLNKISFYILLLISINTKGQLKSNPQILLLNDKLKITLPKSAYFEPSIKNFSLVNNIKTTLKLYPKAKFGKSQSAISLSNALIFDRYWTKSQFRESSIDNMTCLIPNDQIKFHIDIFDPTIALDYYSDNMPNALHKVDYLNKSK